MKKKRDNRGIFYMWKNNRWRKAGSFVEALVLTTGEIKIVGSIFGETMTNHHIIKNQFAEASKKV